MVGHEDSPQMILARPFLGELDARSSRDVGGDRRGDETGSLRAATIRLWSAWVTDRDRASGTCQRNVMRTVEQAIVHSRGKSRGRVPSAPRQTQQQCLCHTRSRDGRVDQAIGAIALGVCG
jgi:hypothetical protein